MLTVIRRPMASPFIRHQQSLIAMPVNIVVMAVAQRKLFRKYCAAHHSAATRLARA
jgi:hypothetical protein